MTTNRDESGFSLIEVLVALVLLAFSLLAVAPMFVYATRTSAVSADYGWAGALAVQRMELLRTTPFNSLAAGGDPTLASNVTGFFDSSDPRAVVRWYVQNNATPATIKTVSVKAIPKRQLDRPNQYSVLLTYRRVR